MIHNHPLTLTPKPRKAPKGVKEPPMPNELGLGLGRTKHPPSLSLRENVQEGRSMALRLRHPAQSLRYLRQEDILLHHSLNRCSFSLRCDFFASSTFTRFLALLTLLAAYFILFLVKTQDAGMGCNGVAGAGCVVGGVCWCGGAECVLDRWDYYSAVEGVE